MYIKLKRQARVVRVSTNYAELLGTGFGGRHYESADVGSHLREIGSLMVEIALFNESLPLFGLLRVAGEFVGYPSGNAAGDQFCYLVYGSNLAINFRILATCLCSDWILSKFALFFASFRRSKPTFHSAFGLSGCTRV